MSTVCSVPRCERLTHCKTPSGTLCLAHYQRLRRGRSITEPIQAAPNRAHNRGGGRAGDVPWTSYTPVERECAVEGCLEKSARLALCDHHFGRLDSWVNVTISEQPPANPAFGDIWIELPPYPG